ncbi:hypothetical protein [Paenarthrobacter nitroguajacolicus]
MRNSVLRKMGSGRRLRLNRAGRLTAAASIVAALLSGAVGGLLSYWGTSQTNATALEVVRETARENTLAELSRVDRERKEAAYLDYINAIDALHDLRHYQWSQDDLTELQASLVGKGGIAISAEELLPPPVESEDKLRSDVRGAANRIMLVIAPADLPLVDGLNESVQLRGLHMEHMTDKNGPIAIQLSLDERYYAARVSFVNAYRRDVLQLPPLLPTSQEPSPG